MLIRIVDESLVFFSDNILAAFAEVNRGAAFVDHPAVNERADIEGVQVRHFLALRAGITRRVGLLDPEFDVEVDFDC
jgi:hypothetical protein